MTLADLLRTTSFVMPTDSFGVVHALRATPAFIAAWKGIRETAKFAGFRTPPYESLKNALRLLSGGLVRMWDGPSERDPYFIVSQEPISVVDVQLALRCWAQVHSLRSGSALADSFAGALSETVRIEEHLGISDHAPLRPERWVWDAVRWAALRRFISRPLQIEGGPVIAFRFDTEGDAISWEDPIRAPHKDTRVESLHKVSLRLITVPGISRPIIHASSSLSAIAHDPRYGKIRKAWIGRGPKRALLFADLSYRFDDEKAVWDDRLVEIAQALEVMPIPAPFTSTDVRVRWKTHPRWFPIGKGPGQRFHDAVARHGREVFLEAEPLTFRKAIRQLPAAIGGAPTREQRAVAAIEVPTRRVLALPCSSEMRERIGASSKDFVGSRKSKVVDLRFAQLPGAREHLALPCDPGKVVAWAERHVRPCLESIEGCLVETVPSADRKGGRHLDPKFVMRGWLAAQGIGSQFISADSVPKKAHDEDHAAHRAWWDLFRTMGIFLRPFPSSSEVPVGTPIVGLQLIDPNRRELRDLGYQLSLVAVRAGTGEACAYVAGAGWLPLGAATPRFHASRDGIDSESDVRRIAETALKQLMAGERGPGVLFVTAESSRRIWKGLSDVDFIRGGLPAEGLDRLSVVRVRTAEDEVPRPAGVSDWEDEDHRYRPGTMNALVRPGQTTLAPAPYFYASTSATMGQNGQHRSRTRFTADAEELGNDWHSLTLTELVVARGGVFGELDLVELGAMLCRQAPTWDGTLQVPSPIHLANRMIEDHPGVMKIQIAGAA